ncbi:hypothetical protein [Burkholderia cenocepacia]|uniref:hypothetical protein n=1 Tax=Burkholderia cenocepacia TaxID=95486 RepID=UPI000F592351|nr:hypothetical protein [Burkholderia cenocepacia]RQU96325.1 hypothetical protein DF040_01260 [Burkholderia cenocepacia]
MHYHPDDISRLFLGVPTLQLNRAAPAERFLAASVESGVELRHVLRDYPHVRYQPLDFHYLCQQSLSALDDPLLADLTCEHGWRGAHWAALLIVLSGNARYLPHLDATKRHRGVEWTAELAKAASAPDAQSSAYRCCRSIVQLRHQLAALPHVVVRLRPWHSPEALEARANAVRAAYRSGGADAALPLARR